MKRFTRNQGRFSAFFLVSIVMTLSVAVFELPSVKAQSQPAGPNWSRTSTSRLYHDTLTRLYNGKVIAVGGFDSSRRQGINNVEIYDPLTNEWRDTAPLNIERFGHSAILLADGRLLVMGGFKIATNVATAAGPSEIFDPVTEKWTVLGTDNFFQTTIFPLPNGKVLALSGIFNFADVFDPATGTARSISKPTVNIANPLYPSTLVLPDSRILLLNGSNGENTRAQIFDFATESWATTNVPSLDGYTFPGRLAAVLPNGQVLGLVTTPDGAQNSMLFSPSTGTWSNLMRRNTGTLFATGLPNGEVLSFDVNSAEIFSNNSRAWRTTSAPTQSPRALVILASGQVFTGSELYGVDFGSAGSSSLVNTSAASFRVDTLAKGSIVAAFGTNLGDSATPNSTQISVKDSSGFEYPAVVLAVSPQQVNFILPISALSGQAEVTVKNRGAVVARSVLGVVDVSPGVFTANADGRGVPAAVVQRIKAGASVSYEPVASFDSSSSRFVATPIDLGPDSEQVYLALFGTGWSNQSRLENVQVYIGDVRTQVLYAGIQPGSAGLDQINVRVPRSLIGRGEVDVYVTIAGKTANPVKLSIK